MNRREAAILRECSPEQRNQYADARRAARAAGRHAGRVLDEALLRVLAAAYERH